MAKAPFASPLEREVIWRSPGGLRGLVNRIGIGHVLVAEVDGRSWRVDLGGLPRVRPTRLLIDGAEAATFDAWPRRWIDTVHLQHLERDAPDRWLEAQLPIDMAAAPLGPTLAILDDSGVVVHDLDRGLARPLCPNGPTSRVHAVAVDAAGARVAAGFGHYVEDASGVAGWIDGTVRIFDVASGAVAADLTAARRTADGPTRAPEPDRVHAVAFTPDGDRIVSACGGAVRVHRTWDASVETALTRRSEDDVAFTPDGSAFVTLESNRELAFWERRGGAARRICVLGEHPEAKALAFGRGGALLATASREGVRIWDLSQLVLANTLPMSTDTTAIALTPSGDALLRAGWTSDDPYRKKPLLMLLDARDGRPLVELHGHTDAPCALAIDPRGAYAASASLEGPVRLWRLEDGACARTFDAKAHPPARLAFARGGAELVLLSDYLYRWRTDDGGSIERVRTRSGAPYGGDIAVRDDGTSAGVSRAGAFVELSDRAVVPARNRGLLDLTFDGAFVARTVADGDLVVSDTRDGKELPLLAPSTAGASFVATSPDGIHYATGDGGAARLYRLGVTEPIAVFPSGRVTALAIGGDAGKWLAVGREEGVLEVFEVATGAVATRLELHAGHLRSLSFRADGRVLAVALERGVKLLSTAPFREIAAWNVPDALTDPRCVGWSRQRLVVADSRAVGVFDYPPEVAPT